MTESTARLQRCALAHQSGFRRCCHREFHFKDKRRLLKALYVTDGGKCLNMFSLQTQWPAVIVL